MQHCVVLPIEDEELRVALLRVVQYRRRFLCGKANKGKVDKP